jgi:hypothetical protein
MAYSKPIQLQYPLNAYQIERLDHMLLELYQQGASAGGDTSQFVLTTDNRLSNARNPTAHATSHQAGGSDVLALDTLGAPTDVTTLNATTSAHGLLPKLDGNAAHFLAGNGTYSTPTGGDWDFTVIKSADQDVTNSATLVNDSELTKTIGANEVWYFEGLLQARTNSLTPGVKWTLTFPASGGYFKTQYPSSGSVTTDTTTNLNNVTTLPSALVAVGHSALTLGIPIRFQLFVANLGTGGDLHLQFANSTAGAGLISRMGAGSILRGRKIA